MNTSSITRTASCMLVWSVIGFAAQPFSDSFEGTSIYPYWAVSEQSGIVSLSRDQAYSGSQSLKFASVSGNDRTMTVTHKFARLTKGDVSIAFYDSAPGQETLYEQLILSDSSNPNGAARVGTNDFDAYCYMARVGSQGPNANCGIYPQQQTTPVRRTQGWHVFSIYYDQFRVSIWIDGQQVYSVRGDYRFDTAQILVEAPYWRPDSVAYFDCFSFTPLPAFGWMADAGNSVPGSHSMLDLSMDRSDARGRFMSPEPPYPTQRVMLDPKNQLS